MSIEVLFSHEKERIRRPEDVVVCCLHSCMTANGYKCIGSGEKVSNKFHTLATKLLQRSRPRTFVGPTPLHCDFNILKTTRQC